jgi:hypothetical protein
MALDKNDIQQLIAILQKGLMDDAPEVLEEPKANKKTKTTKKKTSQHKPIKSTTGRNSSNKFLSMPELHMHKEDIDIDRILSKQPPVSRNRNYTPVKVTCRLCGRSESVHPQLITEGAARYKCNKCSTTQG